MIRKKENDIKDPHAQRRDVKREKKLQPQDNRKSVMLIAKLSSKPKNK